MHGDDILCRKVLPLPLSNEALCERVKEDVIISGEMSSGQMLDAKQGGAIGTIYAINFSLYHLPIGNITRWAAMAADMT